MKKLIVLSIILFFSCVCYAGDVYTTKSNHVASVFKQYYEQAVKMVSDGDKQAFDVMISAKKIFILKEGLSVYIVERKWPGMIKIRLKGSTTEVWTAKEAVGK